MRVLDALVASFERGVQPLDGRVVGGVALELLAELDAVDEPKNGS